MSSTRAVDIVRPAWYFSRQLVPAGLAERPRRGYFSSLRSMPREPDVKRAVSFIDGQNLFRHAKDAFGHYHPNYDVRKLSDAVCAAHGWVNRSVRFYTGVPRADLDPMWHDYWTRRLLAMRRSGIVVTSRPLRYRVEHVPVDDRASRESPIGDRSSSRSGCGAYGAPWRTGCGRDLQPGSGPRRGRSRGTRHCSRCEPVVESCFGLPVRTERHIESGYPQDGLVQDGQGIL